MKYSRITTATYPVSRLKTTMLLSNLYPKIRIQMPYYIRVFYLSETHIAMLNYIENMFFNIISKIILLYWVNLKAGTPISGVTISEKNTKSVLNLTYNNSYNTNKVRRSYLDDICNRETPTRAAVELLLEPVLFKWWIAEAL